MARVVFFPHPEFGHLNPPLKLARKLAEAGHCVYYMGLADFEEYIRMQGLSYLTILKDSCPKGYLGEHTADKAALGLDNLDLILWDGNRKSPSFSLFEQIERDLAHIVTSVRPDLFVIDFKLRELSTLIQSKFAVKTSILSVTLIDLALVTNGGVKKSSAPVPELFLCPKEFDFNLRSKENRYYIEASIELERKTAGGFSWKALDPGRKLVYCSFGSQPHNYRQSRAMFRAVIGAAKMRPEWQFVLAAGSHLCELDLNDLAPNSLVVDWAPQLEMLSRAAMMITHGGLGAVKECIFFSVPMIVLPFRWDQPHNAARVVHHGLGVRGDSNDVSVQQICTLIDALASNPSFKRRVEVMSRIFRTIEDSGIGVKTVEKILRAS